MKITFFRLVFAAGPSAAAFHCLPSHNRRTRMEEVNGFSGVSKGRNRRGSAPFATSGQKNVPLLPTVKVLPLRPVKFEARTLPRCVPVHSSAVKQNYKTEHRLSWETSSFYRCFQSNTAGRPGKDLFPALTLNRLRRAGPGGKPNQIQADGSRWKDTRDDGSAILHKYTL